MPLPRRPQLSVINRLQNILIQTYNDKCNQNENYPDMNSFVCSLMYVLFYHIQCLNCVIKRSDGLASEDGKVTIIRAITRLTHLSDYQLAPVHFIVCTYTYTYNHGYFVKLFIYVWVVFV